MSDPFELLLPDPPQLKDQWGWATVTQQSPLRIRLDGDATPLPITPGALVGGLQVGDRVWCQFVNRRVLVLGKPLGGGNTTVIGRQVGEVFFWLAPVAAPLPAGTLELAGGTANRVTYADLWNLWGTTYGAGDGSTTFGLPDFRGKSPFGYDSSQTEFNAIGKTGGEKTHALTAAENGPHTHGLGVRDVGNVPTSGGVYDSRAAGSDRNTTVMDVIDSSGTGAPHQNLPPYLVGRWLVKAQYTGAEVNPTTNALLAYPVGSIYMSVNNTNPGTLFGGTWVAWATGRMPIGMGDLDANNHGEYGSTPPGTPWTTAYGVESKMGEMSHLLTAPESGLREHSHLLRLGSPGTSIGSTNDLPARISGAATAADPSFRTGQVTDATFQGGNSMGVYGNAAKGDSSATSAHNNMPPVISVYMWKRTA